MALRTVLSLALLLLVVTAGCLGESSPGTDTETATQTPTPTAASPTTPAMPATETSEPSMSPETTVYATACPPRLSVEPATEEEARQADRVVAFEDLSPERQRRFERALDGGTTLDSGDVDPWVGTVVEYRGTRYATHVAVC